jgi:hypothetical protein
MARTSPVLNTLATAGLFRIVVLVLTVTVN